MVTVDGAASTASSAPNLSAWDSEKTVKLIRPAAQIDHIEPDGYYCYRASPFN